MFFSLSTLSCASSLKARVIKNTGHGKPVETWSTGMNRSTRIHKQNIISLHSNHHLLSPLQLSPFTCQQPLTLAEQNADPKIKFQSPYCNLVSGQAKSFIRCLAAPDPLHCPTTHDTTAAAAVDFSLILRQNWSPRVKWRSALNGIRATNRFGYFAAAASWSNTQNSG